MYFRKETGVMNTPAAIETDFSPDFFEVHTAKIGKSLFWHGPHQAGGSRLIPFTGAVVKYDEIPPHLICYVVRYDRNHYLVPNGSAMFANHSCDPNCLINDDFYIETIKPLAPGDEITISYDQVSPQDFTAWGDFWDKRWTFHCQCGSEKCIGLINGYRVIGRQ